ncbi:hypothetical protein [Azotosporobacter soli]|uniref:capsular polysaccharide export protein, LipB/KpsS family n=1 Tax=Azotosporobacter soli TaxID=3055040 RepID=UPI0031FE825C
MKIAIHGFGSFPIFFYELIKYAKQVYPEIEWAIIFPTSNYLKQFKNLLGDENVYYLHDEFKKTYDLLLDKEVLVTYSGNIYRDIESDKKTIKGKSSIEQEKNAISTYLVYKKFLQQSRPDYLIFPHVESHEGMILNSLAKEMGVVSIFPCNARNIGESYFSHEVTEPLPHYAVAEQRQLERAKLFLEQFEKQHQPPSIYPESLQNCSGKKASVFKTPLYKRMARYFQQLYVERSYQSIDGVRYRILNNLPLIRNLIWASRTQYNKSIYDYKTIEEFPTKFIYYPLQYTPESSINTPAPYYVDQLRVIDAIRMSMPSEYTLIVKEHPSCILIRGNSLINKIRKRAGVRVAYYKTNSREIISKAALTISVTGTAAFEAFLLGREAILFGDTFFSEFLDGKTSLNFTELKNTIEDKLNQKIPFEKRVESIAKIYSCTNPFILYAPGDDSVYSNVTLSKKNVKVFMESLIDHIGKI